MRLLRVDPHTNYNDQLITERGLLEHSVYNDVKDELIQGNADDTRFSAKFYKNFALDIVTESVLNYPYPFTTEKTYRPIIEKRMFIILNSAGTLRVLQQQGFKTFNDIIDESYDDILDPELRVLAVAEQVRKFCALDLEYIKQYYKDNADKFEHNYQNLIDYKNKEVKRIEALLDE
jgi:hypothetical protein